MNALATSAFEPNDAAPPLPVSVLIARRLTLAFTALLSSNAPPNADCDVAPPTSTVPLVSTTSAGEPSIVRYSGSSVPPLKRREPNSILVDSAPIRAVDWAGVESPLSTAQTSIQ